MGVQFVVVLISGQKSAKKGCCEKSRSQRRDQPPWIKKAGINELDDKDGVDNLEEHCRGALLLSADAIDVEGDVPGQWCCPGNCKEGWSTEPWDGSMMAAVDAMDTVFVDLRAGEQGEDEDSEDEYYCGHPVQRLDPWGSARSTIPARPPDESRSAVTTTTTAGLMSF